MGNTKSSRILEPRRRQRSWSISQAASISSWIWDGKSSTGPRVTEAYLPALSSPGVHRHPSSRVSHLSCQEHQDIPRGLGHMDLQHRHYTSFQVVSLRSLGMRRRGVTGRPSV